MAAVHDVDVPSRLSPLGETVTRRTVAGRLLVSYAVVLVAFAITLGWSFMALREAARDATLLRGAYVPILRTISEALREQNVMNAQLNHITSANNPADARQWLETARRVRPLALDKLRQVARDGLGGELDATGLRAHVIVEADLLERELAAGAPQFDRLFQALSDGDGTSAERLRDQLVAIETNGARRLRKLREHVSAEMTALTEAAKKRERRSIAFLIGLSVLSMFVGRVTSVYARRGLRPLSKGTQRARVVAAGDLTPEDVVATDDEIGELAHTFEDMVAAIRRTRKELVQAERLATIGKRECQALRVAAEKNAEALATLEDEYKEAKKNLRTSGQDNVDSTSKIFELERENRTLKSDSEAKEQELKEAAAKHETDRDELSTKLGSLATELAEADTRA